MVFSWENELSYLGSEMVKVKKPCVIVYPIDLSLFIRQNLHGVLMTRSEKMRNLTSGQVQNRPNKLEPGTEL